MAPNTGTIKVELEGRGPLVLRPSDYVATGGEGSIYRASGTTVKLYTDPAKMRRDGMAEKVKLLQPLGSEFIMAPQGVVLDQKGSPVGIYMPFAEGEPMPRVFTNTFRDREKFDDDQAKALVGRIHDTVKSAHDHAALMIDPNEMNWIAVLKGKNVPSPRAIDVDSWAIGRFGASVVMPSIRDWHSKDFTKLTDWFSVSIVCFQIFTGIHPYRGTLAGYKPGDFEARMKKNHSVFHTGVSLNRAVRDFHVIPAPLLEFYKAMFERGERGIPPSPYDKGVGAVAPAARALRVVTTASGALMFEKLLDLTAHPAVRIFHCGAVLTASGVVYDLATNRQIGTLQSRSGEVVKVEDGWLLADTVDSKNVYTYVDSRTLKTVILPFALNGYRHVRFENRLFLTTSTELVELNLVNAGKPLLAVGRRTSILSPKSTKWFDGLGVQEAFGANFMLLPFGEKACVSVRARELDGVIPVSGKAGNRFASIIAMYKTGAYKKFEFTFSADYSSYTIWQGGADSSELNIAILPKGVCATIVNDGELVIFVPRNASLNRVSDKQIATDMALAHWNDTVVYIQNGALWSLRMK